MNDQKTSPNLTLLLGLVFGVKLLLTVFLFVLFGIIDIGASEFMGASPKDTYAFFGFIIISMTVFKAGDYLGILVAKNLWENFDPDLVTGDFIHKISSAPFFFILFLTTGLPKEYYRENLLANYGEVTQAVITEREQLGHGNTEMSYFYLVDSLQTESSSTVDSDAPFQVGDTVNITYCTRFPDYSIINDVD